MDAPKKTTNELAGDIALKACIELLTACRGLGPLSTVRLGLEDARILAEKAVRKWSPEVTAKIDGSDREQTA